MWRGAHRCGSLPRQGKVPWSWRDFYRNGPGRLERNGHRVHHPFDGDGMIAAMRFENGGVREQPLRAHGGLAGGREGRKVLYRGVRSQKPGGRLANAFDLRLKNIANTNVVRLGDQLLALWEAAEPHAPDPRSLETVASPPDGVLKKGRLRCASPLRPRPQRSAPHGHVRCQNRSSQHHPTDGVRHRWPRGRRCS